MWLWLLCGIWVLVLVVFVVVVVVVVFVVVVVVVVMHSTVVYNLLQHFTNLFEHQGDSRTINHLKKKQSFHLD